MSNNSTTRSGLAAAIIYEEKNGEENGLPCMFNPHQYTITRSNKFKPSKNSNYSVPTLEFTKVDPPKLQLDLIFDSYEGNRNVSKITEQLADFMKPEAYTVKDSNETKYAPPDVVFKWGRLHFLAVITKMTHKFTLFNREGHPQRAEVKITFQQSVHPSDHPPQNPTSGEGPAQEIHTIVAGDRLDLIAANVYGDSTKWRHIADYNGILSPLTLQAGQKLIIPQL